MTDGLPQLGNRNELPSLLPEGSIGVEVGVCEGAYATTLLRSGRFKRLYGVDTWDQAYPGLPPGRDGLRMFLDVQSLLNTYFDGVSQLIRGESVASSLMFDNASLDLVYIDADHRYDAVSADIRAWWPKLKPGGLFAGHDYNDVVGEDVKRAVQEHFASVGTLLHVTTCDWVARIGDADVKIRSWYGRKPS